MSDLSDLPSIEQLLQTRQAAVLIGKYGRSLVLESLRSLLADLRKKRQAGDTLPPKTAIIELANLRVEEWISPTLVPVINATGVILHTNLGRAPLSKAAIQAIQRVSSGYSSLEFDLEKGTRGNRAIHVENLLRRLTGAEAGLIVNNNAAAVMLVLTALARRKRVIISRTQMVEVGGGFRIPDVLKQSGARLVEIGATNRVHLQDFETALQESPDIVFWAHHSNFKMIGFTSEPSLTEVSAKASEMGAIVVNDLGSGALVDTARFGLPHEMTVQEALSAGASVVCFSGDKLLGGPQAGILVGKADLIQAIKKHPLARALRADKLCLAALAETVLHYLKDEAEQKIPVWQMIGWPVKQLEARARYWKEAIGSGEIMPDFSTIGGGSLPQETLPTFVLSLKTPQAVRVMRALRENHPPIIARVEKDNVLMDPRTVLPEQDGALIVGTSNAMQKRRN